jgi:hypothetical protein
MNHYSFRAECLPDVLNFLSVASEHAIITSCQITQDPVFPDVEVQLVTSCSIDALRTDADSIEDLHVISESLGFSQPL